VPRLPGAAAIVGVWTYEHSTGVPAYERYGADGRMEFRIPMPGETNGTWSLAESTLSMETQGKESRCSVHREVIFCRWTPMGTEAIARGPMSHRRAGIHSDEHSG